MVKVYEIFGEKTQEATRRRKKKFDATFLSRIDMNKQYWNLTKWNNV